MNISVVAAVIVAAIACTTDLRSRRIPNWLTFGAAAAALMYHLVISGPFAAATGLGGWLLGAALFFPMFLLRGMGAGDVKLLAALGAWLGPETIFYVAFFTTLAGGVMAALVAVCRGYVRTAATNLKFMLTMWWTTGIRPIEGMTLNDVQGPRLAYALPIFAGLMVTLWIR